jgi:phosphoglycerol transferase
MGLQDGLALCNGLAVLLATTGGFGAFFILLTRPWIRGFNRISVFIAFFSFFALALLLDRAYRRYATGWKSRGLAWGLLAAVLAAGVLDQASVRSVPRYAYLKKEFANDAAFVRAVETSLPEHARIFQLPYMLFPEHGRLQRMDDYDLFRGYLHSKHLHWSYGAMKGRPAELWQREVASKSPAELVQALALAGFSGIYIDRYGLPDGARALEKQLADALHVGPLVSGNHRLAFYPLAGYAESLRGRFTQAEWSARQEAALRLPVPR